MVKQLCTFQFHNTRIRSIGSYLPRHIPMGIPNKDPPIGVSNSLMLETVKSWVSVVKYMIGSFVQDILRYLFPLHYLTVKMYGSALDAELVSLHNGKKLSLLDDFVDSTTPEMPLVVTFGSLTSLLLTHDVISLYKTY